MSKILMCSADEESARFVVSALEELGHSVVLDSCPASILLRVARYDVMIADLSTLDLPEGALLNAARILCNRDEPGVLIVGVPAKHARALRRQTRIVVLPAPFAPSQVVEAVAILHRRSPLPNQGSARPTRRA